MSDWTHTAALEAEIDGMSVLKEYRWRFADGLDAYGQPRIVAQHRRVPAGGWCEVRSPDRLAQLRALSAVNPAGAQPVEGAACAS